MRAESFQSQLHQAPVEAGARPIGDQRPDQRTWNPECSQPARHVDPIGSSEWLDEGLVIGAGGGYLVVVRGRPFDLRDPALSTARGEVLACERDGRRDIIERLVGPDPEVVEDRGDRDLLEVEAVFHNGGAQVQNAVRVVPIADEVMSQLRRVIVQNLIDRREAGAGDGLHHRYRAPSARRSLFGPAYRLTNSSAF